MSEVTRIPYQIRWNPVALETVKKAAKAAPKQTVQSFIEEAAVAAARRKLDPGTPELTASRNINAAADALERRAAKARESKFYGNQTEEAAKLFLSDAAELRKVARLVSASKFQEAREVATKLDPEAREEISDVAWNLLFPQGGQSNG